MLAGGQGEGNEIQPWPQVLDSESLGLLRGEALPASSHQCRLPLKASIPCPLPLAGLTCMVMRRDHQRLTPGPTANCTGDTHTHNQVLLGIPARQVGPGPLHYQLTLQPGKTPIVH